LSEKRRLISMPLPTVLGITYSLVARLICASSLIFSLNSSIISKEATQT
jgi:hypothetical protein